jgi:hypothetical protein
VETFNQPQASDNEESKLRHDVTSGRERAVESIGTKQPYGVKMLSMVDKSVTVMNSSRLIYCFAMLMLLGKTEDERIVWCSKRKMRRSDLTSGFKWENLQPGSPGKPHGRKQS